MLSQDHRKSLELVNISNQVEDTPGHSTKDASRDDFIKACGKIAQRGNYFIFGLKGNLCIVGSSDQSALINGGSLQICQNERPPQDLEGKMAVDVYKIVDTENFELSVRAYESCGSNFCRRAKKDEKLLCSAGTRPHHHLLTTMFHFMFVLWSLW